MTTAVDRRPDSAENPHAGFGAVVLDIGGDVGALVVTMPEAWVGEEVEIESADGHPLEHGHGHGHGHGHSHRPHVAVVRRPVSGGDLIPSLVFPELRSGRYRLYPKGSDVVVMDVVVEGGAVTSEHWPQ